MKNIHFDTTEQSVLDAFDQDVLHSVEKAKSEKTRYARLAKNALQKTEIVNVHIFENDLSKLKERASREGVSYQSYISSLVHKHLV